MTGVINDAISELARSSVKAITPYASARRSISSTTAATWLNANENALATEYQVTGEFNRYPDCQPATLLQAYANYAGVTSNQVLVSRGADEAIELLIRSFCEPKQDSITLCPPTYGMYAISAQSQQVNTNIVPLTADCQLDLPAILATKPKLVFICSPNNPTGNIIPQAQIITVVEHFKNNALVVVDEAYIEFISQSSVASLLNQHPNLVVLRTLSKAFALAGLRCGFTLANADVINALKQIIAPYPLAEPVVQIACQALQPDAINEMQQKIVVINQLRNSFIDFAKGLSGINKVWPSDANFVLLQVTDAAHLIKALHQQGILVRNQSNQLGLTEVVRVSMGNAEQMQNLQQALQNYFNLQESI
ncbi:histidinol-phosphate transaminase [Rheinheimera sp. WS51]|uniref:histidinol-phosphate transaminase n=1 Tax=Rheinheimera sp. WS51 TaxID=3425886 RepID=UPI003D917FCD